MAEKRTYRNLTIQSLVVLCIAAAAAVLMALGACVAGMAIAERHYLSDSAAAERVSGEIGSFRAYVAEHAVASTDVEAVEQWNRGHRYTQLTIKGLSTTISSNYNGAELVGSETGLLLQSGQVASSGVEFTVNFADGSRSVMIYESSETVIYQAVHIIGIAAGVIVFLAIVLLYDQQVTRSIQTLSRQVNLVSQGDLDRSIHSGRRDEIGQLALDVDNMRLSIIDKLQREEEAWQANSQLITAISHDVRTPLTALMGYLELLEDHDLPEEERAAYLDICKNNAQRLKSLTDELFGFFLVFGKPTPDLTLEEVDGGTLLDQILVEHELSLKQQGLRVSTAQQPIEARLRVDPGHIRRVFDNLFSNVLKYADPAQPVTISHRTEDGMLRVRISNAIPVHQPKVESNKIGLQTCRKLLQAMGGEFRQTKDDHSFTAEVILPIF